MLLSVQVLPQRSDSRQELPWLISMAMVNLIYMFAERAKRMITRRLTMPLSIWEIQLKMESQFRRAKIKAGLLGWMITAIQTMLVSLILTVTVILMYSFCITGFLSLSPPTF